MLGVAVFAGEHQPVTFILGDCLKRQYLLAQGKHIFFATNTVIMDLVKFDTFYSNILNIKSLVRRLCAFI